MKINENQPKFWILLLLWSKYPEHEISALGFKNYKKLKEIKSKNLELSMA